MSETQQAGPDAVAGQVERGVRPHALAYARARVSMLGAGEDMDAINRALDEHARVLDKAYSYIVDNARLAEEVDRLREALTREEAQYPDMQRDAERYRWLRLQDWDTSPLAVVANPMAAIKLGHDAPSRDRLDAMIDAHVAEVQGFLNHTLDGLALGPNTQVQP